MAGPMIGVHPLGFGSGGHGGSFGNNPIIPGLNVWRDRVATAAPGSTVVGPYNQQTIDDAARRNVTVTPSTPTVSQYHGAATSPRTSTRTVAPSGPSLADQIAAQQKAAEEAAAKAKAEAQARANTAARNTATDTKTRAQQDIEANRAQISTNQAKLDALRDLIAEGLVSSRDTNLANVDRALGVVLKQARENYDMQLGDLNTALRDNEKAEADTSFANLANRAREKQDLVTQALSQGAGESDVLKTQLQALRNWDANQGEINRSYFDTLTSANASITDLGTGTRTAMTNAELDANAKRAGVYGDYFSSVADSYTQMDNLATNNYLLEGEIDAANENVARQDSLLAWLDSGKNAEEWAAPTARTASTRKPFEGFADEAAEWAGKSWNDPGVSKATAGWQGQKTQVAPLATSQVWDRQTNTASTGQGTARKRPEGAVLRRW